MWSYPSEILSYETRARGVTFQTGVLHVFGFFVTFVNPIGLDSGWKYYIAYVVYTCLEVYFYAPARNNLLTYDIVALCVLDLC